MYMDLQSEANRDQLALNLRSIEKMELVKLLGGWQSVSVKGPLYARLALSIRSLIVDARIPLGARMPGERPLASALYVSRTTVSAAYELLRDEGLLKSRRGGGSWTALPHRHVRSGTIWGSSVLSESNWIDLVVAAPPGDERIADALSRASASLPRYLGDHGYHSHGLPVLREKIAQIYTSRGLPTSADQILITNGALQAIALAVRALGSPMDRVVLESPTYPGAIDLFNRNHFRIITVGTEESLTTFTRTVRQVLPRLIYMIPDFHNPTGKLLDATSRQDMVRAAQSSGSHLLVDESFVELSIDNQELPPSTASFSRDDTVISIGSMSKAYWGGLRIGWIRAGRDIVARLVQERIALDMGSPILDQLLSVELLAQNYDLLESRRQNLRNQRDALVSALKRHHPTWQFKVPSGGLSLWVNIDNRNSTALATAAEHYQVRLAPGSRFGMPGTLEGFIRLPYTLPSQVLLEAVERLAMAATDARSSRKFTFAMGETVI